jgi:hypothetical protein
MRHSKGKTRISLKRRLRTLKSHMLTPFIGVGMGRLVDMTR